MNLIQNQLRRPLVAVPLLILIIVISGYFIVRGSILKKAISFANKKIENSGYSSVWNDAHFKGINGLYVRSIQIGSKTGENHIRVDSLLVKVKLIPLLVRNIKVRKLTCGSVDAWLSEVDSSVNHSIDTDSVRISKSLTEFDLAGIAYQNIRRFINHVPSNVEMKKIEVNYIYSADTSRLILVNVRLRKKDFSLLLRAGRESDPPVNMPVKGNFDRSDSRIQFFIYNPDTGLIPVPLLRDKFGFSAGFDSLSFRIDLGHRNRHMVNIKGKAGISGLEINGERLSTGNIVIENLTSDYLVHIGPHYIEADSSTIVTLNRIEFNPYLKINLETEPVVDFKILPQNWQADEFFSSLPPGMFTSLSGTKAEGQLDFFVNFSVKLNLPDSLKFNIGLKGHDFRLLSFGTDDYRMLNHSFNHKVYYKGNMVASFIVGPENPDFAPFETISPFLRYAVMTSEDGSFFFHNGFNPDAFRESIATNIKEQRFARGGSTITMQLVKNVFLTRNKTVARKIEEALIVWIIENLDLVPKQRMYEVYLNIIEWGPGIYGVTKAADYYFGKKPSALTLNESVFMASIVPRPKWFKYTFESNGRPRPFFSVYFNRVKELMVRKQFILPTDTVGVSPLVMLTGPAAMALDTSELKKPLPEFIPMEPIRIRELRID